MPAADAPARILNLMQFARKAGKLVAGSDATLRALHRHKLYLIIVASDTAERTVKRMENHLKRNDLTVPIIRFGNQSDISNALGLPLTGVFGIYDKQFADKMLEYHSV